MTPFVDHEDISRSSFLKVRNMSLKI